MANSCVNQNPFEMVYSTLWECALTHPNFVRDVKERNRLRFDAETDRDVIKPTIQASDVPEVALWCQSLTANLFNTSSTSQVTRTYAWLIATGDMRYTGAERLAKIEWCIFTAMHSWKQKLGALRWQDKAFVKRVGAPSSQAGPLSQERSKNLTGWSAIWTADVEMYFDTSDLIDELKLGE